MASPRCAILLLLLAAGCCSDPQVDPRKYFPRGEPLDAVVSFSWSVAAESWEHVADCIAPETQPISEDQCRLLAALEVETVRHAARERAAAGGRVVLEIPYKQGFDPKNGRDRFIVHLQREERISGHPLWRIELAQTLAANSSPNK